MLAGRTVDGVLDDRFVVRELHHRGGQGELYVAYDQATGQRVALKVLRASGTSPETVDRVTPVSPKDGSTCSM